LCDASEGNAAAGCEADPNQPASEDLAMTTTTLSAAAKNHAVVKSHLVDFEEYCREAFPVTAEEFFSSDAYRILTRLREEYAVACRRLIAAAYMANDLTHLEDASFWDATTMGGRRTNLEGKSFKFFVATCGDEEWGTLLMFGKCVLRTHLTNTYKAAKCHVIEHTPYTA